MNVHGRRTGRGRDWASRTVQRTTVVGLFGLASCLLASLTMGERVALAQLSFEPGKFAPLIESEGTPANALFLSASFTLLEGQREGRLSVKAELEPDWHVYSLTQPKGGPLKTVLTVEKSPDFQVTGPFDADRKPEIKHGKFAVPAEEHEVEVVWSAPIRLTEGVSPEDVVITVQFDGQYCHDQKGCFPKNASLPAKFAGYVSTLPAAPVAGDRGDAAEAPDSAPQAGSAVGEAAASEIRQSDGGYSFDIAPEGSSHSLAVILPLAFLGGFILNFMPCVLPVIGLKVMSFVQQAGHSRRGILVLNVWYAGGLLAVFMVLATLLVVFNLGWGEQFNSVEFNVAMISVIFVMALSFLGIWEIPIPGFAGGSTANDLAAQEGPAGAFAKGVVTTILATPCSGPGLATALAWCSGKPPLIVYAVFATMGLGMAFPYLVIGLSPGLARLLPRPGAWMDTFKQLMGFVLMGTVIYMFTFIPAAVIAPALALLLGLAIACWLIGRTPPYAEFSAKLRAWVIGGAVATIIGVAAFQWPENKSTLPWKPFSVAQLEQLTNENKTVLVDFTADWCLTCKFLEANVLNTEDVKKVVSQNGVETLVADWTDRDPEMAKVLEALGSKQVPVLAIFPAGKPRQPIVLIGTYTKGKLLEKLEQAGPSRTAPEKSQVAAARVAEAR